MKGKHPPESPTLFELPLSLTRRDSVLGLALQVFTLATPRCVHEFLLCLGPAGKEDEEHNEKLRTGPI